jgi:methionyl-tRNA synthetase
VRALNRHVEERAPWRAAKDPARAAELDETLATLLAGLRAVTVELHPFLPASAATVLAALDAEPITAPPPLFPKQPAPA